MYHHFSDLDPVLGLSLWNIVLFLPLDPANSRTQGSPSITPLACRTVLYILRQELESFESHSLLCTVH